MQPDEPLECIDELTLRLACTSDPAETLVLRGRLGLAWLERYERDGDEEDFRAAVGCLRQSVAAAPDHPDRPRWLLGLGLGYAERGRRQGSMADYHEAMHWLAALYVAASPDCRERVRAAAVMGELGWERYWLVRHRRSVDVMLALTHVDRFLAQIGRFLTAPGDPAELTDLRLVVGFAYLERYELTGDRAHLVRGIDLLAAASVWNLPESDPRRCGAGSELVDALRQLSILDDDLAALDRAVAAAVRTMKSASPADGTAWFLLHRYGASAAYYRWQRRGNAEDLDLAYRCWQPLLHLDMDPASAREYRAMLRDRDETTGIEPQSRP